MGTKFFLLTSSNVVKQLTVDENEKSNREL